MMGECNKDTAGKKYFWAAEQWPKAKGDLNSHLAQHPCFYCMQLTTTLVSCSYGFTSTGTRDNYRCKMGWEID